MSNGDTIGGPFAFGDHPPRGDNGSELFGWLGPDVAEPEFERLAGQFIPFGLVGDVLTAPGPPIWDFAKRVNGGRHIECYKQEIGDCVGNGAAGAVDYMEAYEIGWKGEEEEYHRAYAPFIYGTSRVQIGGGRIPGDGSTGAWAAAAMVKYGILFSDDAGVPPYSGSVSKKWGDPPGPPSEFMRLAKDNLVKSAARLRSIDEVRQALSNYYPVTIASSRGFAMKPVVKDGYHVFKPQGTWMHQMCLLGWMDEPFAAAYRMNSWGENPHGKPLNGEPPGGAWNLASDLEQEIKTRDVELYALSLFNGFPGGANWAPL